MLYRDHISMNVIIFVALVVERRIQEEIVEDGDVIT